MAAAFVQAVSAEGISASSVTTSAITTTTGNQVYIGVQVYTGGTDAATPITDSNSNTWTKVGQIVLASHLTAELWYCASITGGSGHTFTYSLTASGYPSISVMEFSGMATSSPLDVGGNSYFAAANATTVASPNITTLNAGDVLIAVGADTSTHTSWTFTGTGATFTSPSGSQQDSGSGEPIAMAYAIISATGTYAVTLGGGGSAHLAVGIAAFKQAAVASTFPAWRRPRRLTIPVRGAA